uniref:Small ribosomal subunit protein mS39 n=1 Tax=Syphacia muris TaxID=451379 RepID=A0A0N5ADG8_9BILA
MLLKRLAASAISISRGVKNAAPEKMKMAKFVGQTPRGPIHDGWALSGSFIGQYCTNVQNRVIVKVPKAIQRTHTELLEALSNTIGVDETAPHFSLIDDPVLIPSEMLRRKNLYMAKEMGRRVARTLAAEWPTLFQYDHDEPRLDVFRPAAELDPTYAEPIESNVIKLLDARKIRDAIKLFERLSSDGIKVSKETLVCQYDYAPHSESEEWHGLRNFYNEETETEKPLEQGGIIDLLFETLEKSEDVYSAVIAGLCKYPSSKNVERANKLYEEMKSKKLKLHHEGYCGLVRNAQSFETACSLCKEMAELGIRPNIDLFNSLLETILKDCAINREEAVSKVLEEARLCSCEFSLTTFRNILKIFKAQPDMKIHVTCLLHILEQMEQMDVIKAVVAKEQLFFVEAMETAFTANNVLLAERILKLYNSPKNKAKLPELTDEASFYTFYLRLSILFLPIEKLENLYKSLVPRVLTTSRSIMRDMLDRLVRDFKWSLFRRFTEDNICSKNILEGFCVWKTCNIIENLNFKDLTADEREECRELVINIVTALEKCSKFPGHSRHKWTPSTLVSCASVSLKVGEDEKAVQLLQYVLDKSLYEGDNAVISVVGFPQRSSVLSMMNHFLSCGDWKNACYVLEVIDKYSKELQFDVASFVPKIESRCKLTPMQKAVLHNFSETRLHS